MKPIVQLVAKWSEFEARHPGQDMQAFCRYILASAPVAEEKTTRAEKIGMLARVIGRLASVYGLYHRAAMAGSGLPANDSFFFLNVLNQLGEVNKSELINYLLVETTTGMAAINKLIEAGLVKERPDRDDKRAKLIKITDKGTQKLKACMAKAKKVNEMVFKDLSDDSIAVCVQLLQETEKIQTRKSAEVKHQSFDEMYAALMTEQLAR